MQNLRFFSIKPPTDSEIIGFCEDNGMVDHKRTGKQLVIKECPFCHETNGKLDNIYKLNIELGTGLYICHRCQAKGNWYAFRRQFGGNDERRKGSNKDRTPPNRQSRNSADPDTPLRVLSVPKQNYASTCSTSLLDSDKGSESLIYLTDVRGLTRETLRKYGVGRDEIAFTDETGKYAPRECVTFPWILPAKEAVEMADAKGASLEMSEGQSAVTMRIKVRGLDNKAWQRMMPSDGGWGMFGYHTIPEDASEIIVTEGEFDAMAGK